MFKTVHDSDNISINNYLITDLTSTIRNNEFKIVGKQFWSNEAKRLSFNIIVNILSFLALQITNSNTIETFTKKLGKHLAPVP